VFVARPQKYKNVMCNIMSTPQQINSFIEKYDIENELKKCFFYLLSVNSCEDLGIHDKNLQIDESNIEYKKSLYGFHLFKSPILKENIEIGYYALQ